MPPADPLTFTGRFRSVRFALQGIVTMLRSQQNAWIHAAATVVVVAAVIIGLLVFWPHVVERMR